MVCTHEILNREFLGQRWSKPKMKILSRNLDIHSKRTEAVSFWAASVILLQKVNFTKKLLSSLFKINSVPLKFHLLYPF